MPDILSLILEAKKKRVEVLKKNREGIASLLKSAPPPISFKKAIFKEEKVSLIGEIKQASPSAGVLKENFSALEIARTFSKAKIDALSILTEEDFFLGKLNYIEIVKKEINLPILRKDFIFDEVQVLESRAAGADAVLLIMRILDEEKFKKLYTLSRDLNMDVLVEVYNEKELRRALKVSPEIIGINNRNLHTFAVDLKRTEKLIPFIPTDVAKVSMSGIGSLRDILWLKGVGVNAVLIGEAFMKAEDINKKIKEFLADENKS